MMTAKYSAYFRLMRFHQPVGIVLLWCPTAWALWVAQRGMPSLKLFLIFFLGTIIMRAAGCVVNDMFDKDIDKYVQRTQYRPIAHGELSVRDALIVLFLLLSVAFFLVLQLPIVCMAFAVVSLGLTFIYPLCKRYIQVPQLVLGATFSMGIPMAYAAVQAPFELSFYCLFLLNALWIVYYDTAYAMADKSDDLRIGVKSTAIWFGRWDVIIMTALMWMISLLWLIFARLTDLSHYFYWFWFVSLAMFFYQWMLIKTRDREKCFRVFKYNALYGLWMWLALFVSLT